MVAATDNLDLVALRQMAKGDLYLFSKGVLQFDWIIPHIHKQICDDLMDETSCFKLIVLPRGWLKTTLGSN